MLEQLNPVPTRQFSELPIAPELLQTLNEMGLTQTTTIQDQSFDTLVQGRDLIGCSQTGSGKTVAFLLPIYMRLIQDPSRNALIMTPTRELGAQVHEVAIKLAAKLHNFRCTLIVGGGRMQRQHKALKTNPRIVVATPGRLLDHLYNHSLKLKQSSIVVLDEADRMLDMGFAPQIDKVFSTLPPLRQTILFSATFSKEVTRLIERITKNPTRVTVKTSAASKPKIEEKFIDVTSANKNGVLVDEIAKRADTMLIFAKTQVRVDRLAYTLRENGIKAESIHGGRSMGQRRRAMDNFKSGAYRILIATDIAARGLDVDNVGLVVNYDPPQTHEDYVHRIGRTGRAGKTGESLSLTLREDMRFWALIKKQAGGAEVSEDSFQQAASGGFGHNRRGRGGAPGGGGGGNKPYRKNVKKQTFGKRFAKAKYSPARA